MYRNGRLAQGGTWSAAVLDMGRTMRLGVEWIVLTLIVGMLDMTAQAVEISAANVPALEAQAWQCKLQHDEFHHVACTPCVDGKLPWEPTVGPNGYPLLDSFDEFVLAPEKSTSDLGRRRFVPLFTVPYDLASVERLVRAALCDRGSECRVRFEDPASF